MEAAQTPAGSGTRLAGAAGVAGTALGIFGSLVLDLFDAPGTDATAAEIIASIGPDRTAQHVGMLLSTAAVSLWVVFAAGVWVRLREAAGGENALTACFAFGFVGLTTLLLAGFTCFFVLMYRMEVADARLLYDLAFALLAMSGAPTAIALGAFAAFVWRVPVLPRWTAWLAAVAALTHVALLGSLVIESGFFSLEGQVITAIPATLFIWIMATGAAMAARPTPAEQTFHHLARG